MPASLTVQRGIYDGQLVMCCDGGRASGGDPPDVLSRCAEQRHLSAFETLLVERRVRPTFASQPAVVGGCRLAALGVATALLWRERAAEAGPARSRSRRSSTSITVTRLNALAIQTLRCARRSSLTGTMKSPIVTQRSRWGLRKPPATGCSAPRSRAGPVWQSGSRPGCNRRPGCRSTARTEALRLRPMSGYSPEPREQHRNIPDRPPGSNLQRRRKPLAGVGSSPGRQAGTAGISLDGSKSVSGIR